MKVQIGTTTIEAEDGQPVVLKDNNITIIDNRPQLVSCEHEICAELKELRERVRILESMEREEF